MITKAQMIDPILTASPSFTSVWNEFLNEWKDEKELPIYLVLGELARHITKLHADGQTREVKDIFSVVEKWHLDGDSYVQEAASVGLLEDLQNSNVVGEDVPHALEAYLLPETRRWWDKVNNFWEKGEIISEQTAL
jgi:hypothetical protein